MRALVLRDKLDAFVGGANFYLWIPEANIYISTKSFEPHISESPPAEFVVEEIDVPFDLIAKLYYIAQGGLFGDLDSVAMDAWRETSILSG